MRSKLVLFAAVCVASLALSTSSSAATILAFSQQFSTDFVAANVAGGTTTLTTNGPASGATSIPITITQLGTLPNQTISAFETFLPTLTSTTAPTSTPGGGVAQNGFTGTILISTLTGGGGGLFLTAAVVNGHLEANGAGGGFNASSGTSNGGVPTTVTLTSANPNIAPLLTPNGGPSSGAVSLTLVDISPPQDGSLTSFRATNTGNFSTVATTSVIPEPAGILSASTAILAGLGCFGWSRRKSHKA